MMVLSQMVTGGALMAAGVAIAAGAAVDVTLIVAGFLLLLDGITS